MTSSIPVLVHESSMELVSFTAFSGQAILFCLVLGMLFAWVRSRNADAWFADRGRVLLLGLAASLLGVTACLSDMIFQIRPAVNVDAHGELDGMLAISVLGALFPVLSGVIVLLTAVFIAAAMCSARHCSLTAKRSLTPSPMRE